MTSAPRLRYGFLGCGDAATRLFWPGLSACAEARLVAVASRDPSKAQALAARAGCDAAPSYAALLARDDVDVVYVGLPVAHHAEWTRRALEHGKHVHCEKTFTDSLGHVAPLLELAEQRRLRVMEGFMYRFHGLRGAVSAMTTDGTLGRLRGFAGSFGFRLPEGDRVRRDPTTGMGALHELGCYPIHAARAFFGAMPDRVHAALDYADGIDVSGFAALDFPGGGTGLCDFGFERAYRCAYRLWGTEANLHVDRAFTTPPTLEPVIHVERADGPFSRTLPAENHFSRSIDAFCRAIRAGDARDVFEDDLWRQARVMEAVRLSARSGASVALAGVGA